MAIQEKIRTAEDLWELSHRPEYADMRLELSEGRLIVMSPASWIHGDHALWMGWKVAGFVNEHSLGKATAAETGYILFKSPDPHGKDIVRALDVGFVAADRVPDELPDEGYVPFAPDLAIEVVSPNDKPDEIDQKVGEYLKYGTRLVWVLYSKTREVKVHAPGRAAKTLRGDDILDGEDILPGFKLIVREIFGK
jgi:Uma2 family endonuclease